MTSSRVTSKPTRTQRSARSRPAEPAPMTAMRRSSREVCMGVGLLRGECGEDGLVAGLGVANVVGDASLFLVREYGQHREDLAQGDRDVVNVVHGADGFTGKRHCWNLLLNLMLVYPVGARSAG